MKKALIVAMIAATGSQLFGAADSAQTASSASEFFTRGDRGGELSAFGIYGSEDDSFAFGHANLYFNSASFHNVRANVGLSAIGVAWKDDAAIDEKDNFSLHTANIGYFGETIAIAAGRGELDLVLAPNYYEVAYGELAIASRAKILAAYIRSIALPDYDDGLLFSDYEEIGDDGVFALDLKLEIDKGVAVGESFVVNPYYYYLPDVASWYGGKVEYYGITGQAAFSAEDDKSGAEDGFFGALQIDVEFRAGDAKSSLGVFGGVTLAGTDGIGTIGAIGVERQKIGESKRSSALNPFWDGGAQIFLPEAATVYLGFDSAFHDDHYGYYPKSESWWGVMIGATRADEKTYLQFNFHGDYRIAEGLKAEAALVTGKFGDFGGDVRSQTKVGLGARYIF